MDRPAPQHITVDPWFDSYARRTSGLSASEVRALFAVANRPEVVSLAGGMPFVRALDNERIKATLERVMDQHGPQALQYGSGQGDPGLRERILDVMSPEGISARADDIIVTTGSQQGLDLLAKLMLNPGDVILAESPSYVGAIGVFRSYEAQIEHVAMDEHGLIPEALTETIQKVRAEGRTIKMIYVIPNFHNPAGVTLQARRRSEILDIAKSHEILLVEDNPYGLLWFDSPAPAAIRSADDTGVVYLGSFSKTFAPGLRVGWIVAPHGIREKLVLLAEAAILCPSSFTQHVVRDYLEVEDWRAQVDIFRGIYRERRDTIVDALAKELPGLAHTTPNGGFYVWVTLPEGLDSKDMLPRAVTELVAYTPGTAFYAHGEGRGNLRLAFCYPEPDYLREGIRRLAKVIRDELQLVQEFGGRSIPSTVDPHVDAPPPHIR